MVFYKINDRTLSLWKGLHENQVVLLTDSIGSVYVGCGGFIILEFSVKRIHHNCTLQNQ